MQSQKQRLSYIVIAIGLGSYYSWFLLAQRVLAYSISSSTLAAEFILVRIFMDIGVIAVFVFALLFARYLFPLNRRYQPPLMPLAVVGMFLVAYNQYFGEASIFLAVLGMICIGAEYGWLTMVWLELFSLLRSPRYVYQMVSGILVAALIIILATVIPFTASIILSAILPAISTLALPLVYWLLDNADDRFFAVQKRFQKPVAPFSFKSFIRRTGMFRLISGAAGTFAVYGFVFSFVSVNFIQGMVPESIMRSVGFAGAGVMLLAALLLSRRRLMLSHVYWTLQPLFITGILLITTFPELGQILISITFMLMMVLCAISICEVGRRFDTPVFHLSAFVFGIGTAACMLGVVGGFICSGIFPYHVGEPRYLLWILIIVLTVFTAVTSRHGGFSFNISMEKKSFSHDTDMDNVDGGVAANMHESEYPQDFDTCKMLYFDALARRSATFGERFSLTAREVEILGLMVRNLSNESIASELHLSTNTVKVHSHNILEKLGVHKRSELLEIIQSS